VSKVVISGKVVNACGHVILRLILIFATALTSPNLLCGIAAADKAEILH
jgi:hypothetical protein